jgi:hypothetical protein
MCNIKWGKFARAGSSHETIFVVVEETPGRINVRVISRGTFSPKI